MPARTRPHEDTRPWWTYGYLWLVISGPLAVVVAALVSGWIAIRQQDPVLSQDYYRQGLEINKTLAPQGPMAPAEQGRNHAATPPGAVR
ncbi:FixH family protein [Rhodoferax sp.]|uniref:FixH family protein n=1 Tax=Rhodoferax sp. TaxID=50421 RepID=UPI00374D9216